MAEVTEHFKTNEPKGEFVIIVGPKVDKKETI